MRPGTVYALLLLVAIAPVRLRNRHKRETKAERKSPFVLLITRGGKKKEWNGVCCLQTKICLNSGLGLITFWP